MAAAASEVSRNHRRCLPCRGAQADGMARWASGTRGEQQFFHRVTVWAGFTAGDTRHIAKSEFFLYIEVNQSF